MTNSCGDFHFAAVCSESLIPDSNRQFFGLLAKLRPIRRTQNCDRTTSLSNQDAWVGYELLIIHPSLRKCLTVVEVRNIVQGKLRKEFVVRIRTDFRGDTARIGPKQRSSRWFQVECDAEEGLGGCLTSMKRIGLRELEKIGGRKTPLCRTGFVDDRLQDFKEF